MRVLQDLRRQHSFEIDVIDIDLDPTLRNEYDLLVPVVLIEGNAPMTAPISYTDLERCVARLPRQNGRLRNFFRRL